MMIDRQLKKYDEPDRDKIGQERLSRREMNSLPLGNQYTSEEKKAIVKWQVVKAAAIKYGVSSWTEKVDPKLTYRENVNLMKRYGVENNEQTMRQMKHKLL